MMNYNKSKVGLILQIVISIIALIFAVVSFFYKDILVFTQIFIALDMFIMAYNNYYFYRRKNFTWFYVIGGLLILIIVLYNLLGGLI